MRTGTRTQRIRRMTGAFVATGLLAAAAPGGLAGLASVQAQSGTGAIEGRVIDAAANIPLAGAEVVVLGTTISQLADASGHFLLASVPAGPHVVEVRMSGYAPRQEIVTVVAGQTVRVDFALGTEAVSLESIVVGTPNVQAAQRMLREAGPQGLYRTLGRPPDFNTESYAHIEENDFQTVSASPLSTFSIDVDRASYANIRRFVNNGNRPPIDAVRIEEMINYFPYSWGKVTGDHPFSVQTEVWAAPWKPEHRLVRIGLHARAVDTEHLPPSNLVFLLDVSGSMESPDKLPLLKKAFALLVEQLRPQDRVAIVVYAGAAGLVLPSTSGDEQADILAALEELQAGGSTAGGAGIVLAYATARKHFIDGGNNRVILATDGDFNVGASSDSEMVRLIEKERDSGVFLTVLGFGTGNLKDSKMEQIADHGNGNFHYVDNLLEARKVLVEEMGGTLLTLAKDVKLQIEFNPKRAAGYRLIGYENRLLDDEDFADDTKDAGELGAGHTVTALYEVVPIGVPVPREGGADSLRYQERPADPLPSGDFDDELMYVNIRYKDPDGDKSKLLASAVEDAPASPSEDFRFAAAVAGFGMLLRESAHAGKYTLDDVIALAKKSRGDDERGYRGEFVRLVETVRDAGLLDQEAVETERWHWR